MDLNFEQVQAFIETNKGDESVSSYLNSFVNADTVNTFLEGEDGRSIVDSITSKGIAAYQEKGQVKAIEKAVKEAQEALRKELNPEETPKDRQIRELLEWKANSEKDALSKELKIQTNSLFNEKGYSTKLADFVNGDDIETIGKRAEALNSIVEELVNNKVAERLNSGGHKPPKDNGNGNVMTLDEFDMLSEDEKTKMTVENWDIVQKILANK